LPEAPHHKGLATTDAVKLEAIGRLLRQALRLAEGAEAAHGHGPVGEPPAVLPPPAPAPPSAPAETAPTASPASAPRPTAGGAGGPAQVGYLLGLLQAEQTRLDEIKKEVARKDTELSLKLQFSKKKEEELESREGDLKKLEAQLRIRETQLSRREEKLRELGRSGGSNSSD
jgi:hypothetical protein